MSKKVGEFVDLKHQVYVYNSIVYKYAKIYAHGTAVLKDVVLKPGIILSTL